MASIVVTDVVPSAAREDASGTEYRVAYWLRWSSTTGNAGNLTRDASLPSIGDAHPGDGTATVISKSLQLVGARTARVVVVYRREADERDGGLFSMASQLQSSRGPYDHDGNVVTTSYTYPPDPAQAPWQLAGEFRTEAHELELQFPTPVLRWTRTSRNFTLAFSRTLEVTGAVNSTTWQGVPPERALCTRSDLEVVTYDPYTGAGKWREVYEFAVATAPEGWQKRVTHHLDDKWVPVNPNTAAGAGDEPSKDYQPYRAVNFGSLDLDFG